MNSAISAEATPLPRSIAISPPASEEEVAAIVAALSRCAPHLLFGAETPPPARRVPSAAPKPTWRFSGRWWQ